MECRTLRKISHRIQNDFSEIQYRFIPCILIAHLTKVSNFAFGEIVKPGALIAIWWSKVLLPAPFYPKLQFLPSGI